MFEGKIKPQTDEHYRIMEWIKEQGYDSINFSYELLSPNQIGIQRDTDVSLIVTCTKTTGLIETESVEIVDFD